MSEQNVEIVGRAYQHFQTTGDILEDVVTPDVVWDMSKFGGWPEQQLYHGVEGVRSFFGAWIGPWDDYRIEVESFRDEGDKVVAVVRQQGRSRATGVVIVDTFAQVWTVRDGEITRMDAYHDTSEALKSLGLAG